MSSLWLTYSTRSRCSFLANIIFLVIYLFAVIYFIFQKRLEKQRAALEKKMKEEQAEQAEVRKQEDKIVG